MANYEEDIEGRTGLRADDQNAPTEPLAPRHGGVPEVAKQFITYLHKHIKDKAVFEILSMYENSFNKITEKYFKSTPWPAAESISHLVDNDALFLILYRELYYRHLHTKMFPTLEQRFESWKNYQDLFNYLLSTPADQLSIELPGQWLWDIIDEFIYQFQAFCQHRLKIKSKAKEEITLLQNNPQMWNIHTLISILQGLINKGGAVGSGKEGTLELMGYFSNIGLCRIYCLLGDYHLALESLETIDFTAPKALFTQVIGCHISLYYYLGFIYLMMRRYVDSIKTFSTILLYISRTKHYHSRSYQYEQISKKNDQMYALLSICLSLSPQRVEETVHTILREKFQEKMQKMQKGDEQTFEEIFSYSCPKFISPVPPNYQLLEENQQFNQQEALKLQTKLFLEEVKQQSLVPTIRSYLKLYTTIPLQKLADFLETDVKNLRRELMCYKHKSRELVWTEGPPHQGTLSSTNDVDFYLNKDMIHIADSRVQKKYVDYFIRHIQKFEEIMSDVGKGK